MIRLYAKGAFFILLLSFGIRSHSQKIPIDNSTFQKDSVFTNITNLNVELKNAIATDDLAKQADLYTKIGEMSAKMSDYISAENNLLKAADIYSLKENEVGLDYTQRILLEVYMKSKIKEKFDNLYPISQDLANQLNSITIFFNHRSKVRLYYEIFKHVELYDITQEALSELRAKPINGLRITEVIAIDSLSKSFFYEFKLYNAFALIKKDEADKENKGYTRLLEIENDSLKKYLIGDEVFPDTFSLLNFYKSRYYGLINDYKTANYHLLLSDSSKYVAINKYKNKALDNGRLLYKSIIAQEELKYTRKLLQKDHSLAKTYFIATVVTSLLALTLIIFLIYYHLSRKRIKLTNDKLIETNAKLAETDAERLNFIAKLSHELRTPIYGINGLADIIEIEKDDEKKVEYFNTLKISTKYLSMLIDNVLQECKFTFEKQLYLNTPYNISEQLINIIQSANSLAKERDITLELIDNKKNKEEYIFLDKVSLNQILLNLIFNSIKYSKVGSIVILEVNETQRNEDTISLEFNVIDNGNGFYYEVPTDSFSEYNADFNYSKSSSGTGLGLNIVSKLLRLYGSKLLFKTELNIGTHFKFNITFKKTTYSEVIGSEVINTKLIANTQMNILVVDDNKINLLITKKNVEKLDNVRCFTTESGEEAIKFVKFNEFDVILMDINMPEMDGYQTTHEIKKIQPNVPVIALTALNLQDVVKKARNSGMSEIIIKPYDIAEFLKILVKYRRIPE